MKLRWLVFVLVAFLVINPWSNNVKMVQNANAQSTGEVITSFITQFFSVLWHSLGYCQAALSAVLSAFISCYASMMVTAPEFTTGFVAGVLFFFVVGYFALTVINPFGWLSLISLMCFSIPIPLPLELLAGAVCAVFPGSMLGLVLGTLNLLTQRPTPLDVVVQGIS